MVTRGPVVLALALLIAAACGGDDDGQARAGQPTTTSPRRDEAGATTTSLDPSTAGADPSPDATPPPATPEEPVTDLLTDAPLPGFVPADDQFGAGPLDLDAAARAEADSGAERALLETRGFQDGHSRAWRTGGGDVIVTAVYRFATPAGASAYLADGAETVEARGATPFTVPAIVGAVGFTEVDETAEGAFTGHAVAFARGARWYLVVVGSPDSGRSPDDARAVAAAQEELATGT